MPPKVEKPAKKAAKRYRWVPDMQIRFSEKNPKREGSKAHGRYGGYLKSRTIKEAMSNGATWRDFDCDYVHGYLKVSGSQPTEWIPGAPMSPADDDALDEPMPLAAQEHEPGEGEPMPLSAQDPEPMTEDKAVQTEDVTDLWKCERLAVLICKHILLLAGDGPDLQAQSSPSR